MRNSCPPEDLAIHDGYTIVELMIGLVIGLLVGTVAITFMISSSRTLATQSSEDIIQENARFALEILASSMRLAGSNSSSNPQTQTLSQGIFRGKICDGNDCNVNNNALTVGEAGVSRITTNTDSAAFEYIATSGKACNGSDISVESQIVSVFYVADEDGDGVTSLYCEPYQAFLDFVTQSFVNHTSLGSVPLIDGIEMLQLQYGVDTDSSGTIDRYMSYDNLVSTPALFDEVKAVRLGLILSNNQEEQSASKRTELVKARTYTVLDGTLTANDAMLRQAVSTTVFLPNSRSNL